MCVKGKVDPKDNPINAHQRSASSPRMQKHAPGGRAPAGVPGTTDNPHIRRLFVFHVPRHAPRTSAAARRTTDVKF